MSVSDLGLEISRSTLANLESGRRDIITVPELLVLAVALDVAPVELVVPLGTEDVTEIVPGQLVSSTAAMEWIAGETALSRVGSAIMVRGDPRLSTTAGLYRAHAAAIRARDRLRERGEDPSPAEGQLAALRALMLDRGLRPPSGSEPYPFGSS